MRAVTLEPLGPSDFPARSSRGWPASRGWSPPPAAIASGAEAHLREAAEGWRRQLDAGERGGYWLDLGRPPVAGLVEPDRELEQVERELTALDTVPA